MALHGALWRPLASAASNRIAGLSVQRCVVKDYGSRDTTRGITNHFDFIDYGGHVIEFASEKAFKSFAVGQVNL